MSGLTPGERKFREEWAMLTRQQQWDQHLDLYRRYHSNLTHQIQSTVAQLPQLRIENNK